MLVAYGNPDMFSNAERRKTVRISIDIFRPVQNSLNGMYNTKKQWKHQILYTYTLSLYHIQYKRVSKETRKNLCYGGLLRTGWYVRNRVYVYSSDRGGDGQDIYACYVSSAKCAVVFKLF